MCHLVSLGLALQREPLIDTETMLLVEDNESEAIKFDAGLEQGMRSDHNLRFPGSD
jgi:hypothetical protein